jgi:kynurenine formamidase
MTTIYGKIPQPNFKPEYSNLIKTGVVYSLSFVNFYPPRNPSGMTSLMLSLSRRHKLQDINLKGNTKFTEADETIVMSGHSMTHLDALCHIGEIRDGKTKLYGGIDAGETEHYRGFRKLGIEGCPPIITRGVLLDVPLYKDVEVLPVSYSITAKDLQGTSNLEGVEVKQGDCVLIRTGFSKIWRPDNEVFYRKCAGPELEGAQWLIDRGVIVSGSDTISYERNPSPTHPVHRKMINNEGILLMKLLNLEEIAQDKVYEFLFIAMPLRIFGATASPINPIAVC